MARLSKSNQNLNFEEIAGIYSVREQSLKLFYSIKNPHYYSFFVGYSEKEVKEELSKQISEVEKDACLNLLASIEALFRIDYANRCEQKDKTEISRKFRELFADYQHRIPLEDGIFEVWKNDLSIKSSVLTFLKGAFKYRHWLAHDRYWNLKAGKQKYDFYELYQLALEVEKFPFKK